MPPLCSVSPLQAGAAPPLGAAPPAGAVPPLGAAPPTGTAPQAYATPPFNATPSLDVVPQAGAAPPLSIAPPACKRRPSCRHCPSTQCCPLKLASALLLTSTTPPTYWHHLSRSGSLAGSCVPCLHSSALGLLESFLGLLGCSATNQTSIDILASPTIDQNTSHQTSYYSLLAVDELHPEETCIW
jgi:hypothetical protein